VWAGFLGKNIIRSAWINKKIYRKINTLKFLADSANRDRKRKKIKKSREVISFSLKNLAERTPVILFGFVLFGVVFVLVQMVIK
jgi:hypothetical protein